MWDVGLLVLSGGSLWLEFRDVSVRVLKGCLLIVLLFCLDRLVELVFF